jgi:hypothetical protein
MSDVRVAPLLRCRTGRAAERGSAYLFVLLVLLVLTVIGLSLLVITQTEAQIGGAEKSASRVLYGADAGLRIQFALSRFAATKARRLQLGTTRVNLTDLEETVDVSPFYPVQKGPCNLCSVNKGSDEYWAIDYLVNAQGLRVGKSVGGSIIAPQATRLLSQFFIVQPEKEARVDESIRTYDPTVTTDDPLKEGLEVLQY